MLTYLLRVKLVYANICICQFLSMWGIVGIIFDQWTLTNNKCNKTFNDVKLNAIALIYVRRVHDSRTFIFSNTIPGE